MKGESAVLYFAYGSNLDTAQMRRRCPGARLIGPAVLPNHALHFAGFSASWRGSVASVERRPGWSTQGLLYRLTRADLDSLDVWEGYPFVYDRCTRVVVLKGGTRVHARVYVHRERSGPEPSQKYLGVIGRAYRKHGFDLQPLNVAVWGLS